MEWAEETKNYLNELVKKSGVKVGGAKASAMEAIVMLLDENTLNGTLCAMKHDAQKAKELKEDISKLQLERDEYSLSVYSLKSNYENMSKQKLILDAEVKALTERAKTLRETVDIAEMLPEERSRFNAYKRALEIGTKITKEATSVRLAIDNDVMAQIIRSAAIVAAGFTPREKRNTQEEKS